MRPSCESGVKDRFCITGRWAVKQGARRDGASIPHRPGSVNRAGCREGHAGTAPTEPYQASRRVPEAVGPPNSVDMAVLLG